MGDRAFCEACGDSFNEGDTRTTFKETASKAGLGEDAMLGMAKQTVDILNTAKAAVSLEDALTAMFEIYDQDKSGFVTIDEQITMDRVFAEASKTPFSEDEARTNFTGSDANKDGKVSLQEHISFFKATAQSAGLSDETLLGMVRQTND